MAINNLHLVVAKMSVESSSVSEGDKLKQRTSLLMRLYWQDEIFKIGRELRLTYFEQVHNFWEINLYQGALEIARNIDDNMLLAILSSHPKPYGISLGGFQGKYYSLDENGQLSFKNSQDNVRKNVRTALKKWGERGYGILQALINKNGRTSYFELIDEIERVLGYEFAPSYVLPRLAPLKLVFKTGSNKYPEWTMPSEIIPVVQEEIRSFKRPLQPPRLKPIISESLLKQMRERDTLANEIIEARRNIDVVFKSRFKTAFFRQNEIATNDLRKPCSNEAEFNNRILSLALLIDGIETTSVSKLIRSEGETGSINLLETLFDERVIDYDKMVIRNLRMIVTLRSKKYPVHMDDPKYLNALSYFGFTDMPPDWQNLWETILCRYLESLRGLLSILLQVQ
jgi:hypothetical protein